MGPPSPLDFDAGLAVSFLVAGLTSIAGGCPHDEPMSAALVAMLSAAVRLLANRIAKQVSALSAKLVIPSARSPLSRDRRADAIVAVKCSDK